jgi:hypothetical protein
METISINKISMGVIFEDLKWKGQFSGKMLDRYW